MERRMTRSEQLDEKLPSTAEDSVASGRAGQMMGTAESPAGRRALERRIRRRLLNKHEHDGTAAPQREESAAKDGGLGEPQEQEADRVAAPPLAHDDARGNQAGARPWQAHGASALDTAPESMAGPVGALEQAAAQPLPEQSVPAHKQEAAGPALDAGLHPAAGAAHGGRGEGTENLPAAPESGNAAHVMDSLRKALETKAAVDSATTNLGRESGSDGSGGQGGQLDAKRARIGAAEDHLEGLEALMATDAQTRKASAVALANAAAAMAGSADPAVVARLVMGVMATLAAAAAIGGALALFGGGIIAAAAGLAMALLGTVVGVILSLGPLLGAAIPVILMAATASAIVLGAAALRRAITRLRAARARQDSEGMDSEIEGAAGELRSGRTEALDEKAKMSTMLDKANQARAAIAGAGGIVGGFASAVRTVPGASWAGATANNALQVNHGAAQKSAQSAQIIKDAAVGEVQNLDVAHAAVDGLKDTQ